MENDEQAVRDELAKFASEVGATGIEFADDEGNTVDTIEAVEVPSTPITGHGDEVFIGDLVLVTRYKDASRSEEGVMRIVKCMPIEHEEARWTVLATQDREGQDKELNFDSRGIGWHREFMLIEKGGTVEVNHCCESMNSDIKFKCNEHPHRFDCPDVLMHYNKDDGRYGIIISDGGNSWRQIAHCPWCGVKL